MFLNWNGVGATLKTQAVGGAGLTLPPIMACTGPYLLINSGTGGSTISTSGELINGAPRSTFIIPPYTSAIAWPYSNFGTWGWGIVCIPPSPNIAKAQITTGTSSTVAAGVTRVIFDAGAIGAYNLTTNATPYDGQVLELSTNGTITTLTITAGSGTIQGSATATVASFSAAQGASWVYEGATTNWLRRY